MKKVLGHFSSPSKYPSQPLVPSALGGLGLSMNPEGKEKKLLLLYSSLAIKKMKNQYLGKSLSNRPNVTEMWLLSSRSFPKFSGVKGKLRYDKILHLTPSVCAKFV